MHISSFVFVIMCQKDFIIFNQVNLLRNNCFFVNIVESILKITSTVFIVVGRFYELGKMKEEKIGENYVQK